MSGAVVHHRSAHERVNYGVIRRPLKGDVRVLIALIFNVITIVSYVMSLVWAIGMYGSYGLFPAVWFGLPLVWIVPVSAFVWAVWAGKIELNWPICVINLLFVNLVSGILLIYVKTRVRKAGHHA